VSKLKFRCETAAEAVEFVVCDSLLDFVVQDGSFWQDASKNRG
jgi:hypothetical protein